jgi:hypothetical protein
MEWQFRHKYYFVNIDLVLTIPVVPPPGGVKAETTPGNRMLRKSVSKQ